MSRSTTGTCDSETLVRSCSTIGRDNSIPETATPFERRGTAMRPVPMANSRAGPSAAHAASASTTGPTTSGLNTPSDRS